MVISIRPRSATAEEKEILSKYVGWGALAKAFDKNDEKWSAEYQELADLLTPEEYRQARASVNDAFYTSPTIIDGIYEALRNFGFDGGNVLDKAVLRLIQRIPQIGAISGLFANGRPMRSYFFVLLPVR